ncbi:MAG: hypothetical protein IJ197_03970 [Bacteroidaceae bacterium]|nr:hypothetical protein [Bacteroidaceae bacterium]
MKKYIAPHVKVVSLAPENALLGHSFDWADVKGYKDMDEDTWEEEVTTTTSKKGNLWSKEW